MGGGLPWASSSILIVEDEMRMSSSFCTLNNWALSPCFQKERQNRVVVMGVTPGRVESLALSLSSCVIQEQVG
jgi:hypothetical protein